MALLALPGPMGPNVWRPQHCDIDQRCDVELLTLDDTLQPRGNAVPEHLVHILTPIAAPIPTSPAGGASDAATSIPTAAPDTRLLRSDCVNCRAPAPPATSGSTTAGVEMFAISTICAVAPPC